MPSRRFPAPTLTTSLVPTQLYIFSSLVLPILTSPTHSRRLRNMEDLPALAGWISRLAWRNNGREQLGLSSTGGRPGAASSSCGGKGAREDGLALGRSTTQPPAGTGRKDVLGLETATGAPSGTGTGVNTPALVSRSSWRPDLGASSPLSAAGAASPSGGLFGASAASAAAEAANERWEAALSGGAAGGPLAGKKSVAAQRAGKGGCKIVVWRVEDGFAARGNTVSGFVEINRAVRPLLSLLSRTPCSTDDSTVGHAGTASSPACAATDGHPLWRLHLARLAPAPVRVPEPGREGRHQALHHWQKHDHWQGQQAHQLRHHGKRRCRRKVRSALLLSRSLAPCIH